MCYQKETNHITLARVVPLLNISEFFLYILIVSFVTKQKWVYKKKKKDVSLLHFVTPCFVTSFEQFFWTVTSCFRVFPIYLNRFICYETEMGL